MSRDAVHIAIRDQLQELLPPLIQHSLEQTLPKLLTNLLGTLPTKWTDAQEHVDEHWDSCSREMADLLVGMYSAAEMWMLPLPAALRKHLPRGIPAQLAHEIAFGLRRHGRLNDAFLLHLRSDRPNRIAEIDAFRDRWEQLLRPQAR